MNTQSLSCSAWKSLKMIKSEHETSFLSYSVLSWWCWSTLISSEKKSSFESMYLKLHFLLISQFETVFLRITWCFAWSFNIHCISIFWWSCFSCCMLECILFNLWWFNSFFSFIICSWWFSCTFSFISLWSFYVISLRKWKSQRFSLVHSATALCIH